MNPSTPAERQNHVIVAAERLGLYGDDVRAELIRLANADGNDTCAALERLHEARAETRQALSNVESLRRMSYLDEHFSTQNGEELSRKEQHLKEAHDELRAARSHLRGTVGRVIKGLRAESKPVDTPWKDLIAYAVRCIQNKYDRDPSYPHSDHGTESIVRNALGRKESRFAELGAKVAAAAEAHEEAKDDFRRVVLNYIEENYVDHSKDLTDSK